jgi:hypothetical protein
MWAIQITPVNFNLKRKNRQLIGGFRGLLDNAQASDSTFSGHQRDRRKEKINNRQNKKREKA